MKKLLLVVLLFVATTSFSQTFTESDLLFTSKQNHAYKWNNEKWEMVATNKARINIYMKNTRIYLDNSNEDIFTPYNKEEGYDNDGDKNYIFFSVDKKGTKCIVRFWFNKEKISLMSVEYEDVKFQYLNFYTQIQ